MSTLSSINFLRPSMVKTTEDQGKVDDNFRSKSIDPSTIIPQAMIPLKRLTEDEIDQLSRPKIRTIWIDITQLDLDKDKPIYQSLNYSSTYEHNLPSKILNETESTNIYEENPSKVPSIEIQFKRKSRRKMTTSHRLVDYYWTKGKQSMRQIRSKMNRKDQK